jgi:hypothetical protein
MGHKSQAKFKIHFTMAFLASSLSNKPQSAPGTQGLPHGKTPEVQVPADRYQGGNTLNV